MTAPTARADIVALLIDLDFEKSNLPDELYHDDGRPFAAWETHRVGEAKRPELEALCQYNETVLEFYQGRTRDSNRMCELVHKYSADLPDSTPLGKILPRMSAIDRAEFDAIYLRLAPDGVLMSP